MRLLLFALLAIVQTSTQTGSISGRITLPDGTPAAGVRVAAVAASERTDTGEESFAAIGETDRNGSYRLETLPPGLYFIRAGLIGSPTYYPGVSSKNSARIVNLTRVGTLTGIDFPSVQPSGVRVYGRLIFDPKQTSKRFSRLVTMGRRQVSVGADGSFEFTRVSPGRYSIVLTRGGPAQTSITVADKDVEVELQAPLMAEVDARLVPENGARVSPMPFTISGKVVARGTVSVDGNFQVFLPEGEYWVPRFLAPSRYFVKSVESGSVDLTRDPLILRGGQFYSIVIRLGPVQ